MKYTLINLFFRVGSVLRWGARRIAVFFRRLPRRIEDAVLRFFPWLAAIFTFGALLFLIGHILVNGIPYIRPSLFALEYNTENVSLLPALVTTVFMVILSLLIAAPLGLFTAIYLVEYAKRGSRLVRLVRVTAETLSGIPSIVYGLFGSLFFVSWLGWGYSLLAGTLTLSIMILPLIMRTAEESLKAVPDTFREGSFGLGAGRLRTVFRIVLPAAAPGIFAGIILAMGRIVGETAALIYTAGTVAQIPTSLLASGRTLAIHMYALSSEGLYTGQAYATAVVLLVLVVGINALSAALAKRIAKG
ncbi:phosphate ABC transporter permease PstA [uncultured Oscillibacter sp.]|uniref:phosphate ABC transporter permease PstA n=1 Tax=uncultured Oscillibacter sp. TaxID=876091 RepID=UPI0025DB22E8|nr:phosphate ABC transporter permease PstA [uncultured Oscillibacter sp.]